LRIGPTKYGQYALKELAVGDHTPSFSAKRAATTGDRLKTPTKHNGLALTK